MEVDPATSVLLERPGTKSASGFPLEAYFQAILQVIEKAGFQNLLAALRTRLARKVTLDEISEIRIFSEKHGSDYHPAKIGVCLADRGVLFAMNVALHERGRFILVEEFEVLSRLRSKFDLPYLPKVYFLEAAGASISSEGGPSVLMYLADWLEGFYEFHLSIDPVDGKKKMVLWDNPRHDRYLPEVLNIPIYKETARILTGYYDIETFAQIHPWHLAAGDFITRIENDRVKVRLVAARQYGPLIGPEDLPWEEALLFFLLNLTLRIRLDRLDGVGEIAWADEGCLGSAIEGFSLALQEKTEKKEIPEDYPRRFLKFLRSVTIKDLEERLAAIVKAYNPSAPDLPIIEKHLDRHLEAVFGQELFQAARASAL